MAYTYPAVPVGAIYLITMRMRWLGQRVINTWHYRIEQNTNAKVVSYIADLFNNKFVAANQLFPTHKAIRESSCNHEDTQYQMIYPQRYVAVGKAGTGFGDTIGAVGLDVPQLTAVITFRSVEATRRGMANKRIPLCLHADHMTDGLINDSGKAKLEALGNAFLGVNDLGEGVLVRPIIYHPDIVNNYSYVESFFAQTTQRVTRRRTVGQGE